MTRLKATFFSLASNPTYIRFAILALTLSLLIAALVLPHGIVFAEHDSGGGG